MTRRMASRAIIVKDGNLLCLRQKPYRGYISDYWCVAGGGVDEGESLVAALEREIIEELGVKPQIGNLLYVQQFFHKAANREEIEFFFHVLNAENFVDIDLSKTSHGNEEIQGFAFIDPSKHDIRPRFLANETLTNLENRPTKLFNYL